MLFTGDGDDFDARDAKPGELPLITVGNIAEPENHHEIAYLQDYLCVMTDGEIRIYSLEKKTSGTFSKKDNLSMTACSPLT